MSSRVRAVSLTVRAVARAGRKRVATPSTVENLNCILLVGLWVDECLILWISDLRISRQGSGNVDVIRFGTEAQRRVEVDSSRVVI